MQSERCRLCGVNTDLQRKFDSRLLEQEVLVTIKSGLRKNKEATVVTHNVAASNVTLRLTRTNEECTELRTNLDVERTGQMAFICLKSPGGMWASTQFIAATHSDGAFDGVIGSTAPAPMTAAQLIQGGPPAGLSAHEVNQLAEPTIFRGPLSSITDRRFISDKCAICFNEFEDTTIVRQLPCGHVHCLTCTDKWFERSFQCSCRHDIRIPAPLAVEKPDGRGVTGG